MQLAFNMKFMRAAFQIPMEVKDADFSFPRQSRGTYEWSRAPRRMDSASQMASMAELASPRA